MKTTTLLAVGLITIIGVCFIALTYEHVQEHKVLRSPKPATAPRPVLNVRQKTLREKFVEKMVRDKAAYSQQQLKEAEHLYQVANKKFGTPEAKESLIALIEKYPDLDRTGCAVLYMAQMSHGDDRAQYLQDCINKYNGCFYGNGVQVGAYARFLLIQDYQKQGEPAKAEALINEIKTNYADAIDHGGNLLVDSLNTGAK